MFFIPFFIPLLSKNLDKKQENKLWFFLFVFYTLIVGLRNEIGVDWEAYIKHYDITDNAPLVENLFTSDPGYVIVNWFIALFNGKIYLVNLVCAIVFVYGLLKFCRIQKEPWVALIIAQPVIVIIVGMSYTRQSVAIGLEFLALVAISKQHTKKFIQYVLAAAFFHKTALFLIPIVPFISNKNKILMFIGVIALGSFLTVILIAEQYESLINLYVEQKLTSEGGLYRIVLNFVPAIFIFLFAKKHIENKFEYRFWLIFAVLTFLFFPILQIAPTATDRMYIYLIPLQMYVYSNLAGLIDNSSFRSLILIGVLLFYGVFMFTWLTIGTYTDFWVPYRMFPFN